MFDYKPLEVQKFHGGITDNFIDAALHTYEEADNFIVTENQKLYTRDGSVILSEDYPQLPTAQRISAIIQQGAEKLYTSSRDVYRLSGTGWQDLLGPTGNKPFTAGDINSVVVWSPWNKHTFLTNSDFSPVVKVYQDNTNTLRVRSAGLPKMATAPVLTGGGTGTNNYIYSFCYKYSYYVDTVLHVDFGPVTQVQLLNKTSPDVDNVTIGSIPVLANGTNYNWDTTVVTKEIYRTIANGASNRFVASVSNATTSYVDNKADSVIENNATLYIDGGEADNFSPPLCKCLHVTDTLGLYGHIKLSDGQILSNRVAQSKPADPDSVPLEFYVDLDDEIVAISSAGQTPIVLCKNTIYRLDGFFDSKGDGILQAQAIESTVGCISANSVVQIQRGIVFAGIAGFYFTDGFEVRKLSTPFNSRYTALNLTEQQQRRIYGTFDKASKRVWWAVQETDKEDVNKCYILDTRYGLGLAGDDLENLSTCFTTASGGDSFRPTALLFDSFGTMFRADKRGYIFKHSSEYLADPLINILLPVADWDVTPIVWKYKSFATSFGTSLKRKYCPKMVVTADNKTNISLKIVNINDISKNEYELKPLRFRRNWVWGDSTKTWGSDSDIWNFTGLIEETRSFNSHGLRCNYKQIELSNAYVVITNSDDVSTATVNSITKTCVLDNIGSVIFPDSLNNYDILFDRDGYTTKYRILSSNDDTLILEDSAGQPLVDGSYKWEIRGIPKNEVFNLISYALWYSFLGEPVQYLGSTAGSNA